jgi:hypothetical protein
MARLPSGSLTGRGSQRTPPRADPFAVDNPATVVDETAPVAPKAATAGGFGRHYGSAPIDDAPGLFGGLNLDQTLGRVQHMGATAGSKIAPAGGAPAPAAGGGPASSFDLTAPSFQEQVFGQIAPQVANQGAGAKFAAGQLEGMVAPGQSSQYFDQAMGSLFGHTGDGNMAAEAYRSAGELAPADMSAYYENAGRQALERINQNAAARGIYGSSAAIDSGSEALTNLAAERSLREAQYGLDRADMMGRLGSAAEQSQLGWTEGLGGLAATADEAGLARQLAGARTGLEIDDADRDRFSTLLDAATRGDRGKIDRVDTMFDSIFRGSDAVGDAAGAGYEGLLDEQSGLFSAPIEAELASKLAALGYDEKQAQQILDGLGTAIQGYRAAKGMQS